jgi:hypothetical protein
MFWQYRKINLSELSRGGSDIDLLCDAGQDGWELVAVLPNNVAFLKRSQSETAPIDEDGDHIESRQGVKPKYGDPTTGETWSGRGRMATWLKRKKDAGEDIERYRL